ncbi:hypothetical protein BO79DRAFT_42923 [Aspergillus costaricaensis CBS 115574]|uniref:Uncharacterized protein n=1 Tax=Aspergillus costaricaensis CBS 115574 TaxID=1448317 RepID=A0ACD1ITJ4_9EURO|nr:hypothetical protein BO79DRAFT_42923 [Aspergillus costaricaensis CBS 115574]RAK93074.1 hypothetical protein BO79DRAFT_42923 [Aspergillus costaricaensis CBS 115574]
MDGISCEFVLFVSPLLILLAFFIKYFLSYLPPQTSSETSPSLSTKPIPSEIAHQLLCSLFSSLSSLLRHQTLFHIKFMCRNTPHLVRRRTFPFKIM